MASSASFDGLQRCTPEEKGVDSAAILEFLKEAEASGIVFNSFMLYRDHAVISEGWWFPFRPDLRHMMHSSTKSFLSAAVAMAISESFFSLDDKVISFFPEHATCAKITPGLAAMTVEDLITQTSGHSTGASGGTWRGIKSSWIEQFFKIPVDFEPGTHFRYTSATSFMLSAIIQRTTSQSTHAFLIPRLFQPLGITDLTWDVGPEGINPGGNGISCRTSDLLKLAILHLNGGMWDGRRILPETWASKSTSSHRGNPYGYHWWIGEGGSYYAYGLFGQFAFVFPRHKAILVTTSSVPPGEADLRSLVWRHFPAIFRNRNTIPITTGSGLSEYLADLHIPIPILRSHSLGAVGISDRLLITQTNIDKIQGFAFRFETDQCIMHIWDERGLHRIDAGLDRWKQGETTLSWASLHHGYEAPIMKVVARGTWITQGAFHLVLQFVETAFQDHIMIRILNDQEAVLERGVNVNSFSTQRPPIAACILENGSATSVGLSISDRVSKAAEIVNALPHYPRTKPFSCDSASIDELLSNPDTRAVLENELPGLSTYLNVDKMKLYNLFSIANNIPHLTSELMVKIDAQLRKIPLDK